MPYSDDFHTDIDLDDGNGCLTAPAVFSTWINSRADLPTLTLETVTLGKLQLSRTQLCDWLGDAEVKRIERHYQPERWEPETPESWNLEAAE